jgi:hypothetical protein
MRRVKSDELSKLSAPSERGQLHGPHPHQNRFGLQPKASPILDLQASYLISQRWRPSQAKSQPVLARPSRVGIVSVVMHVDGLSGYFCMVYSFIWRHMPLVFVNARVQVEAVAAARREARAVRMIRHMYESARKRLMDDERKGGRVGAVQYLRSEFIA